MFKALNQINLVRFVQEEYFLNFAFIWGARLFKIVIIIILARLALRFGYKIILNIFELSPQKITITEDKKARTISALLISVWRYFIYAFTIILVLTELKIVELGPILAGAGVIGLAVGFGAQSLVRDVIAGFFIILEDQFSVGDYIKSGDFTGVVEELGLRITKIRDFNGEIHIIPNGTIEVVTNRTRGNMRALVDVGVAYEENLDNVLAVLEGIASDFAAAEPDVVEGPTVLGVVGLEDSAVVIRLVAQTVPMSQWKVERDLRLAIKKSFDEQGIEIPYPRHVVYSRSEGKDAGDNG